MFKWHKKAIQKLYNITYTDILICTKGDASARDDLIITVSIYSQTSKNKKQIMFCLILLNKNSLMKPFEQRQGALISS